MKKTLILLAFIGMLPIAQAASAYPFFYFTIVVGGPGEDCPGSSICSIKPGLGLLVSGNANIDDQTGSLIVRLSVADMQQNQPDKLQYYNQQTMTMTWTTDWIAPAEIVNDLQAPGPVVIPSGTYPYTIDANNNYVIVVPQKTN